MKTERKEINENGQEKVEKKFEDNYKKEIFTAELNK